MRNLLKRLYIRIIKDRDPSVIIWIGTLLQTEIIKMDSEGIGILNWSTNYSGKSRWSGLCFDSGKNLY